MDGTALGCITRAETSCNLGRNDNEIVLSTNTLKHMEYDRVKAYPGASSRSVTTPIDDEEANATIDGQLLPHLVGEIRNLIQRDVLDRYLKLDDS